jgi:VIT1/CCC1 family predicted Fe2+/Mn2+ transporter
VEEVHRVRVAAVLAADAELEVRGRARALLGAISHQPADAVASSDSNGETPKMPLSR